MNSTNRTDLSAVFQHSAVYKLQIALWFTIWMIVCVFGTVLNILTVLVTTKLRQPKSSRQGGCKALIINSLVVSTIKAGVSFPFLGIQVVVKVFEAKSLPNSACWYVQFIFVSTTYMVAWADVCLALNRFVAILLPLKYNNWTHIGVITAKNCFVWLLGISFALPPFFGAWGPYFVSPIGHCAFASTPAAGLVSTIFAVFLPLSIVGTLYGMIFVHYLVLRCKKNNANAAIVLGDRGIQRKIALAKVLFMSFVLYMVFQMPGTFRAYLPGTDELVTLWTRFFSAFGLAFTSVPFYLINHNYRTAMRQLICESLAVVPTAKPVVPNLNDTKV